MSRSTTTDEELLAFQIKLFLCLKNKNINYFNISFDFVFGSKQISIFATDVNDKSISINIYSNDSYAKNIKLVEIAKEFFEFCDIKKSKKKLNDLKKINSVTLKNKRRELDHV